MGLYNFQPRFVPFVEDWSKRHTIRAERKHQDLYGKPMHLYTGLRHPGARCLMRPKCVRTDFVRFSDHFQIFIGASIGFDSFPAPYGEGQFSGRGLILLSQDEANVLAWRDGFRPAGSSLADPGDAIRLMCQFWEAKLPWDGTLYHWDPSCQVVTDRFGIRRWEKVAEPGRGAAA